MPDSTPLSASENSKVSFSFDDALAIAQSLGALAGAVNVAAPGAVALLTGTLALLKNTIMPAIRNFQAHELSVMDQAVLAAESAVERARVGAPPAVVN